MVVASMVGTVGTSCLYPLPVQLTPAARRHLRYSFTFSCHVRR